LSIGNPDTVATTGVFRIEPGAVNSIPCLARLEIDLRDTELAWRNEALEQIECQIPQICRRCGVTFKCERINVDDPAICDSGLIESVTEVCHELGFSVKRMVGRAYHEFALHGPNLFHDNDFHPSHSGISYRPDEYSSPDQNRDGALVLARAIQKIDRLNHLCRPDFSNLVGTIDAVIRMDLVPVPSVGAGFSGCCGLRSHLYFLGPTSSRIPLPFADYDDLLPPILLYFWL